MKNILCFGDSNTYGYRPDGNGRYERSVRWAGALGEILGAGYHVVEEGLPGRATVYDDLVEDVLSGLTYLTPCLKSHTPLDLVVIMLGTNDIKVRFGMTASFVAAGVGRLAGIVQKSEAGPGGKAPEVLLIAPPPIRLPINPDWADYFEGSLEKSMAFDRFYSQKAMELGCLYLNAGEIIESSLVDGIHFEPETHAALAAAVAGIARANL